MQGLISLCGDLLILPSKAYMPEGCSEPTGANSYAKSSYPQRKPALAVKVIGQPVFI